MARTCKLTVETKKRIIDAISLGAADCHAAAYAGINRHTLEDWIKRGEAEEEPFATFAAEVADAKGSRTIRWLSKIEQAAKDGEYKAAIWQLEQRHPDEYGRRRIEMTGRDGGPIKTETKVVLLPAGVTDTAAWMAMTGQAAVLSAVPDDADADQP